MTSIGSALSSLLCSNRKEIFSLYGIGIHLTKFLLLIKEAAL